jgi:NADH-ubiquinone oxidoreductase chain 5
LSSYDLGLFHLSNHAFFKALLFLGAGSVIHAMADEQDIRRMGGLRRILPFSYSVMVIGSLALVGFPFLTGFYSKDAILEVAYAKYTVEGHFSYVLGVLAAFCTSFYSTRLLFLVFLSEPNGSRLVIINAKEGSWLMGLPLFILSILTIVLGFMTRDLFIGFGTHFWGTSIFILPQNYTLVDIEFIPLFYKLLPLLISISGTFFAYALYSFGLKFFYRVKTENSSFRALYNFLVKKWYFDRIYNEIFVQSILYFSYDFVYKDLDRGLIEKMGPLGVIETCSNVSKLALLFQTGLLSHYLFSFFLILSSFGFGWVVSSSLFLILSLTTVLFIYTFNEEIS